MDLSILLNDNYYGNKLFVVKIIQTVSEEIRYI